MAFAGAELVGACCSKAILMGWLELFGSSWVCHAGAALGLVAGVGVGLG